MVNSGDVYISGKDSSGNGVNALILDMSNAGAATFSGSVTVDNTTIASNSSHFPSLTINNNSYIGSANATTAIQLELLVQLLLQVLLILEI